MRLFSFQMEKWIKKQPTETVYDLMLIESTQHLLMEQGNEEISGNIQIKHTKLKQQPQQ